jgi:hypothetical protein
MKPVAIGRKNWMFAGSQRGGNSMAIAFTLIQTAKLNKVHPQAWLTWVLERIADHKITKARRIDALELLSGGVSGGRLPCFLLATVSAHFPQLIC